MMNGKFIVLTLVMLLAGFPALAGTPISVSVSIKPLHSLVAAVMEGVSTPGLLIKGSASPHGFSLRPSVARRIEDSDLVFRIGPGLEGALDRPLRVLPKKAKIIDLIADPGILPLKNGDSHFWLDPGNAGAAVKRIYKELLKADPAHGPVFKRNMLRVLLRLGALNRKLKSLLVPVSKTPFVVLHDAYGYLARAYGLTIAGSVSATPDRRPGARHMRELKKKIARLGIRCLFREPGFSGKSLDLLASSPKIKIGVLDPLGAELKAGPELYFRLMEKNAAALASCLKYKP